MTWIKHDYSNNIYQHINPHFIVFVISNFLVPLGQIIIWPDTKPHLITSTSTWIPTCWYYTKPLPQIRWAVIKIVDCGWWLAVDAAICPLIEGPLLCWCVRWLVLNWPRWVEIKSRAKTLFCHDFCHFIISLISAQWTLTILAFKGIFEDIVYLLFPEK